jgi:putative nucleotidyltransferase with HDIG domain
MIPAMLRSNKDSRAEFLDIADVRIGHYIYLDVGWMGHPFALNSFRISAEDQLVTLRALGLERLRYSPELSQVTGDGSDEGGGAANVTAATTASATTDGAVEASAPSETDAPADLVTAPAATELATEPATEPTAAAVPAADPIATRRATIATQRANLQRCENQFNEAAQSYKSIVSNMHAQPLASKQLCEDVVNNMIGQMGDASGETLVRLLSEKAGERTSLHSINVSIVSLLLAKSLNCTVEQMRDIGQGALLHDIGKMELPDYLRWSDGDHKGSELALYHSHVAKGVQIVRQMGMTPSCQIVIGQHHEHIDGSGYPQSIRGEQQALPARIVALVNQYDNLCNPGNPAMAVTPHEALTMLYVQNKGHFDSKILAVFIRLMGVYPPGSVIELSTGTHALVVSVNSTRPLRPNILVHDAAIPPHEAIILDLETRPELGIRRSLKPLQLPRAAYDYLSPRKRLCYFFERSSEVVSAEQRHAH